MKCPTCGKSLWFVQDVCPFCKQVITPGRESGSEAPASPPDEVESSGVQGLVTLMKCGTLGEADALRAQLASAGIDAVIPDEALMQAVAWPLNTYGYVRVQVRSADFQPPKNSLSR